MQMVPESSQRGSVPPAPTPNCPQTLFWGSNKNSKPLLADADGRSRWLHPALRAPLPCSLSWEPPGAPSATSQGEVRRGQVSVNRHYPRTLGSRLLPQLAQASWWMFTEDAERPSKESNWLGRSPKQPNNCFKKILPALPENSSPVLRLNFNTVQIVSNRYRWLGFADTSPPFSLGLRIKLSWIPHLAGCTGSQLILRVCLCLGITAPPCRLPADDSCLVENL